MQSSTNIYDIITSKIINQLELLQESTKIVESRQWGNTKIPLRSNGEPYQGVNVLALWAEAFEQRYTNPYWMTFDNARKLGGHVKKGEKGTFVVFAMTVTKKDTEKRRNVLRGYKVFNVQQIENLPERYCVHTEKTITEQEKIATVEAFVTSTGASIKHRGSEAFYSPSLDEIVMPPMDKFKTVEGYYSTLLHELVHWTKTVPRCNRQSHKRFGDENYAMEELVAEIGASFLCAILEVSAEVREDHIIYISDWLNVLKKDKKAIFLAANHAQKAVNYLKSKQSISEDRESR